ncbi:beta-1,6-N-acetylglucosaminyltransferase [Dyadobacter sp. 32]|uniref:beta-1,6-N-acetylglucosaminyltransferase n=1 Tax=Dyadobacter sp. 32 TaxID=538966 RepID=UPI0011ECDB30
MKLAYLILAHHNPLLLQRLVNALSYSQVDIYIQVDLKTNIEPFLQIGKCKNVFFVEKRVKVFWGAYSQVQAILNGFEHILNSGNTYAYVNLLSGQDYPLQPADKILEFFRNNPDKAFIEYYSIEDVWQEALPRIRQYHLTDFHFTGRFFVQKLMNWLLPVRQVPKDMEPVGRSTWFTITPEHIRYILSFLHDNPKIRRYFRLVWGVDELIFQTILYNSPYKSQMVNDHLRYIDWSAGGVNPKTLTMEDEQTLLNSECLFARKFAGPDSELLDSIDKKILKKP